MFNDVAIVAAPFSEVVDDLIARCTRRQDPLPYRFVNAYSLSLAAKSSSYASLLQREGYNLPDGKPLSVVLRPGKPDASHIPGPAFFIHCLTSPTASGLRHYLLGGTKDTLDRLLAEIRAMAPDAQIVGLDAPPFRPLSSSEREAQDERIRSSGANVVWVGLGTPKQDFEAARIVQSTGVTAVGVGAAFNFVAQTTPTAPTILRKLGLEWLFRLATEPRRLWRRYLFGNSWFMWSATRHLIRSLRGM